MSINVQNQQVRSYGFNPEQVILGALPQQVTLEFELSQPTKAICFGAGQEVSTVPVVDILTGVWLTGITIIINKTEHVIDNMTLADYINVVQNNELKEADIIDGGNMLWKIFQPALPANTKIQIILNVNTLALGTATPAATCVLDMRCITFDSDVPVGKVLRYYARILPSPTPVGIVAATPFGIQLGTQARMMKWIHLIMETPVGTPVDILMGLFELLADGNPVLTENNPLCKMFYQMLTDSSLAAVPAGHYIMKAVGNGYNTANQKQLTIRLTPHTTSATAQVRGFEIFDKNY